MPEAELHRGGGGRARGPRWPAVCAARSLFVLSLSAALAAGVFGGRACGEGEPVIALANDTWTVQIDPASLEVTAQLAGGGSVPISAPQQGLGEVEGLRRGDQEASWELAQHGIRVSFRLEGPVLHAQFIAVESGTFTWPIAPGSPPVRALVLPLFEGSYVPADDAEWRSFLLSLSPGNTTETLSMPFWGLECEDHSFTYIVTNEFNNRLTFEDRDGRLAVRLTHEFTRISDRKEYGLAICLGEASAIEPARRYRRWLMDQGQFVSLAEKIEQTPEAEKLLGAAHVYLWGDSLISRYDVLDWRRFAGKLVEQGKSSHPSPGRRIWELMGSESREEVAEAASVQYPYRYLKDQVARALSGVLARRDWYEEAAWRGIALPDDAEGLLRQGIADLGEPEVLRLNSLLLEAAFPGEFVARDRWGNGVSVKMMERFAEGGFDRLWLGLASWQGGLRHPEAVRLAKDLGYLIGTYDSYHSIHHPDEPDTWETAQFDLHLYETGPVVGADGAKRPGHKRKGYILSPIAVRPYVQTRVTGLMETLPEGFNSWFIDCDAYGEVFDDYSELHTATQQEDAAARLQRMAWIRDTYGLVIGSEGGAAYAAPVIHFAHGMMTPVFGWGDPDLRENRESAYYLGRVWPPDAPEAHVKQVPLKERYRRFFFDPRFRLPLYQTVFHDSVVTTHHWGGASLKFEDQVDTVALLELLYNVPPLYHMNLDEFEKHGERMKAHYAFFSPLHRELGLLPLTDFAWLTPDRLVQRTVFGERVEMVANFSDTAFTYRNGIVPARSILAVWLETGEARIFSPSAPSG